MHEPRVINTHALEVVQCKTIIFFKVLASNKFHTYVISELYIDTDKKAYNALGFQRFGFLGLFPAVLSYAARAAAGRVS